MTTPPPRSFYLTLRAVVRGAVVALLLVYVVLVTADIALYNYGDQIFTFTPMQKALLYRNGALSAMRRPDYRPWLTGFVEEPGAGPAAMPLGDTARACGQADAAAPTVLLAPVDELGFRNALPPARADVLFLGDSFCQGAGSGTAQSIPALFAQKTGQAVYAACAPGLGLFHYARLLDALTTDGLGPDNRFAGKTVYMLVHVGDDLTTDIAAFRQHQTDALVSHARHMWLASLRALQDLDDAAGQSAGSCAQAAFKGDGPTPPTALFGPISRPGPDAAGPSSAQEDEVRKVLAAMAVLARERGLTLRVVVIPTALQVLYPHLDAARLDKAFAKAAPAAVKNLNQYTAFTVSAAEEAGLPVLDMEPLLVGRDDAASLYWPMDAHLTPHGNAVVSDAVVQAFSGR
jgi:hypothetical protein